MCELFHICTTEKINLLPLKQDNILLIFFLTPFFFLECFKNHPVVFTRQIIPLSVLDIFIKMAYFIQYTFC